MQKAHKSDLYFQDIALARKRNTIYTERRARLRDVLLKYEPLTPED